MLIQFLKVILFFLLIPGQGAIYSQNISCINIDNSFTHISADTNLSILEDENVNFLITDLLSRDSDYIKPDKNIPSFGITTKVN